MSKYYLIVLFVIALVSSLWSAEPIQSAEPVQFLGITMGEYIPRDRGEFKAPEGFDGVCVVSPLTRRVTSVTLVKNLSSESKAITWMDTLVSGLALSSNAQLAWNKEEEAYFFAKGRLNVTVWSTDSRVYIGVTDADNDAIHSTIADVRGWSPTAPLLPAPATK